LNGFVSEQNVRRMHRAGIRSSWCAKFCLSIGWADEKSPNVTVEKTRSWMTSYLTTNTAIVITNNERSQSAYSSIADGRTYYIDEVSILNEALWPANTTEDVINDLQLK